LLDHYGIKATFFMVGDNVKKHPEEAVEVINRGHAIGNHTMHHLQGSKVTTRHYMRDVKEADEFVRSRLFRPPHGWLRPAMAMALRKEFTVVMYDLITRDYSKRLSWQQVFENVKRYTRNGSIIVFHDSLKSRERLYEALPRSIEWLISEGYEFATIEPR
jgi:peptidoglycan/xylan/chitin deacetylase (PgdA/CDA1 family)